MPLTAREKYLKRRGQFSETDKIRKELDEREAKETYNKLMTIRKARKARKSPLADIKPVEEESPIDLSPLKKVEKRKLTTPDMTKDELYDLGKEYGVEVTRRMTKDELIEAIDG